MSNLFSYVLGFIFVLPILLFGVDLMMIQTINSGLNAYATHLVLTASSNGLSDNDIAEATQRGYSLACISGCEYPQLGQTQSFVLIKTYTPLFISKDSITLKVEREYLIGYY